MAKFKTLNRLLKRIGIKKSDKENLKRTATRSSFWRKNFTRSPDNGSPSSSRSGSGIGLLRALSSLFKRSNTKSSNDKVNRENELELYPGAEADHDNGILDESSIEDAPDDAPEDGIIEDDALSESLTSWTLTLDDQSDHSIPSLNSEVALQHVEEEHACTCPYCDHQGSQVATGLAQPEDWESSSEWLIFDVPEEPEPQVCDYRDIDKPSVILYIKPSKRVTWEDGENCGKIERYSSEAPVTAIASTLQLWQWTMAVAIIFMLLLFL